MIVLLRGGGAKPALILVHGSDGNTAIFSGLARHLDSGRPIYGISQAIQPGDRALIPVEELAARYTREVLEQGIGEPYSLLGYSFGGLVALEMARQLDQAGKAVTLLGLLDSWLPAYLAHAGGKEHPSDKRSRRLTNWRRHAVTMACGPERKRWFRETVASKLLQKLYGRFARGKRDVPRWLRNAGDLNIFASRQYRPEPYAGKVVLFRAAGEQRDQRWDDSLGWREAGLKNIEIRDVAGTHREFLRTSAEALARAIALHL